MSGPTAPEILRAAARILRYLGDNQLAADVEKKAQLNWQRVELHHGGDLEDPDFTISAPLEVDQELRAGDGEDE